ncbi:MAG TPA: hypothetical protein VMW93_08715 [bacterium]|nr:hypothetical protein [bacterium]
MPPRLLIIAEGEARAEVEGKAAALDLFDGPLFALARSLRARGAWPGDVGLYVLTSEHGLVPADQRVAPSDRRMTPARAAEAIYENFGRLAAALAAQRPTAVMLALPDVYRRALFRKDTPYVQGVPVDYLDPEGKNAADRIIAWLRSA